MRLCFCADARSIHTLRWIAAFANDCDIDLISFDYPDLSDGIVTPDSFRDIGVGVHLVPRAVPGIVATPLLVRSLIRRLSPDLVHAHYVTQYGTCAALAGIRPLVISCWGSDILVDAKRHKGYRAMVRFALRQANAVTVDGENYLHYLKNEFGVDPARIHRISHGVDTAQFSPAHANPGAVYGGGPMILYVRGFRPIHDPLTLVKAIPAILEAHPDAVVVMAGAPGAASAPVLQEADALGVKDAVRFAGNVPHAELPPYLASATVYVSTATSDGGMAVSTLEAMASGCAMVLTNSGDHASLIVDDAAVVVNAGDPARLAAAIIGLLDNPAQRATFGANARRVVVDRYDYGTEMKKMRTIYEDLIARRPA